MASGRPLTTKETADMRMEDGYSRAERGACMILARYDDSRRYGALAPNGSRPWMPGTNTSAMDQTHIVELQLASRT